MSGSDEGFGPAGAGAGEAPPFAVAGPAQIQLGSSRSGTGSFTVSNVTGRSVRARVLVVPGAGADASWFTISGEPERALSVAGTTTVDVTVSVPKHTTAGTFSFMLGAALEESPDLVVPGPTVTVGVPEPIKRKFPWWILIVTVAALLVLSIGGALIWNFTRSTPVPTPTATPTPTPTPTQVEPEASFDSAAAWLNDGWALAIVTWGSASCAPIVGETVFSSGTLLVELTDPDEADCSADAVPRASYVSPATPLDMRQNLRIALTGDYQDLITLVGVPEAEPPGVTKFFVDSAAGWYASDGFVVLSYGSSSCRPEVSSAEVTAPTEVTVEFAPYAFGQICTFDFRPRLTVVDIDETGLGDGPVVAILEGDGLGGERVPIAGVR